MTCVRRMNPDCELIWPNVELPAVTPMLLVCTRLNRLTISSLICADRPPLKPMFFDHLQAMCHTHPDVLDAQHIENLFARTARRQQNHSFMLWKLLNFMIWAGRSRVQFTDRTSH